MKPFISLLTALTLAGLAAQSTAQPEPQCGLLEWNYGPFDYRSSTHGQRRLVESAHFTPEAERLISAPTGSLGGDFRYTLSVFPNHPRALLAMERLAQKQRQDPPDGAKYSVECWYERALRFRPDDHIPRLLYANFLISRQRIDEARRQLDYVERTTEDNPFAQFNVGMVYADIKDYDKALVQAHRAIAMGFERSELKDRLIAAGRWVEPAPAAATAASAPASAASNAAR